MLFPSDSKRTGKKSHYKYKINHMKALWKAHLFQSKEIHINGKTTENVYQLHVLFVADPISCLPSLSRHLFLADKICIWLFIMNWSPRNNHDLYRKKKSLLTANHLATSFLFFYYERNIFSLLKSLLHSQHDKFTSVAQLQEPRFPGVYVTCSTVQREEPFWFFWVWGMSLGRADYLLVYLHDLQ